jgi:transposase InsO family protein
MASCLRDALTSEASGRRAERCLGDGFYRGPTGRWSKNSRTDDCGFLHPRVSLHRGRLQLESRECRHSAQTFEIRTRITESCDNGSELSGGMMDQWACSNQVEIDFSRRGRPTVNAIVEAFNGRFREECLNTHRIDSIDDAKEKIDHWRRGYNEKCPRRSSEGLTPRAFVVRTGQQGVANSKP